MNPGLAYALVAERFEQMAGAYFRDPMQVGTWEALMAHTLTQMGISARVVARHGKAEDLTQPKTPRAPMQHATQELLGVEIGMADHAMVVGLHGVMDDERALQMVLGVRLNALATGRERMQWMDAWTPVGEDWGVSQVARQDPKMMAFSQRIAEETKARIQAMLLHEETAQIDLVARNRGMRL